MDQPKALDAVEERASVIEELADLLATLRKNGTRDGVIASWTRLLQALRRGTVTVGVHELRQAIERAKKPHDPNDEWKLVRPNVLLNTNTAQTYSMHDDAGSEVLLVMNWDDDGVQLKERLELARASSHFTNEEVRAVFLAIVKAKIAPAVATK